MQGIGLAQGPPCACRPAPIPICVDSSPEAYLKSQAAVFQLGVEALLDRQARQKVHAGSWVALPVHLGQVLHHRDRHGVDPAGSKNVNDRMCMIESVPGCIQHQLAAVLHSWHFAAEQWGATLTSGIIPCLCNHQQEQIAVLPRRHSSYEKA